MKTTWRLTLGVLLALLLAGPASAQPNPQFSRMIVFGDSLSDPGNLALIGVPPITQPFTAGPPASGATHSELLVPRGPYLLGGNRLSNGPTAIEQLAAELGLGSDALPALIPFLDGLNFAFAGARADGATFIDLPSQVGLFLGGLKGNPFLLLDGATVFFIVGGNDLRDAVAAAVSGFPGGHPVANAILQDAVESIASQVQALDALPNDNIEAIVVATVPDLGLTPAISILASDVGASSFLPASLVTSTATTLARQFNGRLADRLDAIALDDGTELVRLDLFALLRAAVAEPAFPNVTEACVIQAAVAPSTVCANPNDFLFWDGIHPTTAGHGFLKDGLLETLVDGGLVVE